MRGDRRRKLGDEREESSDSERRQETEDGRERRQETEDGRERREETGDGIREREETGKIKMCTGRKNCAMNVFFLCYFQNVRFVVKIVR